MALPPIDHLSRISRGRPDCVLLWQNSYDGFPRRWATCHRALRSSPRRRSVARNGKIMETINTPELLGMAVVKAAIAWHA